MYRFCNCLILFVFKLTSGCSFGIWHTLYYLIVNWMSIIWSISCYIGLTLLFYINNDISYSRTHCYTHARTHARMHAPHFTCLGWLPGAWVSWEYSPRSHTYHPDLKHQHFTTVWFHKKTPTVCLQQQSPHVSSNQSMYDSTVINPYQVL